MIFVIQFSDIHVHLPTDPVLKRVEEIAAGVAAIPGAPTECVVLFTGDLAQRGEEKEYLLAKQWIEGLVRALTRRLVKASNAKLTIKCVLLPGNHDCYLPPDSRVRPMVIEGIRKDPNGAESDDVQQQCLVPQAAFWHLVDELRASGIALRPTKSTRLAQVYEIALESASLFLCAYNTAWMSENPERPGALVFPASEVPAPSKKALDLVVGASHHPPHWLHPDSRRSFVSALRDAVDLYLTGHEHAYDDTVQSNAAGLRMQHIEADVLQERGDASVSAFAVVAIDEVARTHAVYRLGLRAGAGYQIANAQGRLPSWEPFPPNRARTVGSLEFSTRHRERLDETGISLNHRDRGVLHQSDVYVYPDLRETFVEKVQSGRTIVGSGVLDFVLAQDMIIVSGEDYSGKTALAKALCRDAFQREVLVIWADAPPRATSHGRIDEWLEELVRAQYSSEQVHTFRQTPRERRLIVIDDFESTPMSPRERRDWFMLLRDRASHVVLIGDGLVLTAEDLAGITSDGVAHFQLQPFGYVNRNELIERWLSLGSRSDAAALARRLSEFTRLVDEVIGRNYLPSYPVYLLSVIQAAENSLPFDTSAPTHGYFYEVFIRTELAKGHSHKEIDVLMGFLAFLAKECYLQQVSVLTQSQYQAVHQRYVDFIGVRTSGETLLSELVSARMLCVDGDAIRFKYRYVYYYFIASHLRDSLGEASTRDIVVELTKTTHRKESADVLLFLAHLSKDPFIVAEILARSREHFRDIDPLRLERDTAFLGTIEESAREIAYEESDPRVNRRRELEARDAARASGQAAGDAVLDVDIEDPLRPLSLLNAALRTMQIAGQVLKNYPGHLSADTKSALTRESYLLGLRSWSFVMGFLRTHTNEPGLAEEIIDVLRQEQPGITVVALVARVRKIVSRLAYLASLGFVKRIGYSLGAPELQMIYERLESERRLELRSDDAALLLVRSAIDLEHSRDFPETEIVRRFEGVGGNHLAEWIVQQLVLEQLQLHHWPLTLKQRICQKLKIKYRGALDSNERPKMLPQAKRPTGKRKKKGKSSKGRAR